MTYRKTNTCVEQTVNVLAVSTNSVWKSMILVAFMALMSLKANAQTAVYTFKYDQLGLVEDKETSIGSGQMIIYDNKTIVYKGQEGSHSINRSIPIVQISSVYDGAMITFLSASGEYEAATKNPYIIIGYDGEFAFFYEGDTDAGAKSYSMTVSDAREGQNKATMDRLISDFKNHNGIFSNFVSEYDTELPLTIEGRSPSYTVNISPSGEEKAYSVRTKSGKLVDETSIGDYEVESDAAWARVRYKTDAAFLLTTDPNDIGMTRTATITVTAKGKSTVMTVNQPPATAKIDQVWVEHNKWSGLVKGMKIHVQFHTYNVRGQMGQCAAYFYFSNGQKLMDYNMQYRAMDGQVSCGQTFSPNYDQTVYNDFELFIPYTELHLSGHADCKFNVQVSIGGQYAVSEDIGFTFN